MSDTSREVLAKALRELAALYAHPPGDPRVSQRAVRQASAAFDRIARPILVRYCGKYLRDEEAGKDAASETIVRALRRIASVEASPNPDRWLFTIAVHTCVDEIRKRRVRNEEPLHDIRGGEEPESMQAVPAGWSDRQPMGDEAHWLATREGRRLQARERSLVLHFALIQMARGTEEPIPSGRDLRERLESRLEADVDALLRDPLAGTIAGLPAIRYCDAMLLWLKEAHGMPIEDAVERLRSVLSARRRRRIVVGARPETALDPECINRDWAAKRLERGRKRLLHYLEANGYGMVGVVESRKAEGVAPAGSKRPRRHLTRTRSIRGEI